MSAILDSVRQSITLAQPEFANPSMMNMPVFLMCPPFSLSSDEPNNQWMVDYSDEERVINRKKALAQFFQLYQFVSADAAVYLLPSPTTCGLQDLTFVANLAFIPEHLPNKHTVVISKFSSAPRIDESVWGRQFFKSMGYHVVDCPYRFEGEAELKHLYDNVYIGGYGARSQREAYEWMELEFDMRIIPVEEVDPYLYHLDCSIFPVTQDDTIVCTELFSEAEVRSLEEVTNVIDVSADIAYNGICNSARLHNVVMNGSNIHELRKGTEDYALELAKNRKLEDIATNLNCEVAFFNLSEFHKSGALLSCLMMHLNRFSNGMRLV